MSTKISPKSIEGAGDFVTIDEPPDDGGNYGRTNGSWVPTGAPGTVPWGGLVGTLSDQTDLQGELDAKADDTDLTDHVADTTDVHGIADTSDLVTSGDDVVLGEITVDSAQYNTSFTPSGHVKGLTHWDSDNETLEVDTEIPDVKIQVGQESQIRVYNDTGATITNGTPIVLRPVCGSSDLPCIVEADAEPANPVEQYKRGFAGVVTADIATGSSGRVTFFGNVGGIDTSGLSLGQVYLAVGGGLTNDPPELPASQIRIGEVLKVGTTDGQILCETKDISSSQVVTAAVSNNERTGFQMIKGVAVDDTGAPVGISVDEGTRTLTVNYTASLSLFSRSNRITKVTPQSVTWTDVEGGHFFYYDHTTQTLTHTTTFDESFIFGPDVFVSYLYWDATNSEVILDNALVETHGAQMSGATHLHFHETLGCQYYSGLSLNTLDVDGSGNDASAAQFGVDSGVIADEDIIGSIASKGSTTGLRILYLDGPSGNVRQLDNAGFSVLDDITAGVDTTGRLVYNGWTGTTWQLTTVGSNDFVLCHVFAILTASGGEQLYAAVGQTSYGTVALAREGANTEIGDLATLLPFAEIRPVASLIYQTATAYTNAVKARVRSTDDGAGYIDWRRDNIPGGSGVIASEHNALAGRSDAGTHPTLEAPIGGDQVIKLADNAGATALSIVDSDGTEVARQDSNGNFVLNGDSTTSLGDLVLSGSLEIPNNKGINMRLAGGGLRATFVLNTADALTIGNGAGITAVNIGNGADVTAVRTQAPLLAQEGATVTGTLLTDTLDSTSGAGIAVADDVSIDGYINLARSSGQNRISGNSDTGFVYLFTEPTGNLGPTMLMYGNSHTLAGRLRFQSSGGVDFDDNVTVSGELLTDTLDSTSGAGIDINDDVDIGGDLDVTDVLTIGTATPNVVSSGIMVGASSVDNTTMTRLGNNENGLEAYTVINGSIGGTFASPDTVIHESYKAGGVGHTVMHSAYAGNFSWRTGDRVERMSLNDTLLDISVDLDVGGDLDLGGGLEVSGSQIDFTNLPTTDPSVAGRLWNDSGTVKISAG